MARCGRQKTIEMNQDFNSSARVWPSRAGDGETLMPADSMAAILESAPPLPPAMMAPAWPMRRPGGAVRPAMKPTIGFLLQKRRSVLFRRAADLADHDQRLGRLVGEKHFQHFDEVGALYRIAADADRGGLAETFPRGLKHRLIGQRAGARDDADLAALENVAGHDADLAFAGLHDARAIRTDQARF